MYPLVWTEESICTQVILYSSNFVAKASFTCILDVSEKVVNPGHNEKGGLTDGFVIGGNKKFIPRDKSSSSISVSTVSSNGSIRAKIKPSPYASDLDQTANMSPSNPPIHTAPAKVAKSFILNEDMLKIRQAESAILKEEEKFGIHTRDPEGRLMPVLQANRPYVLKCCTERF